MGKRLRITRACSRGILFLLVLISWNATAQPSHAQDETGQEDPEAAVEEEAESPSPQIVIVQNWLKEFE